MPPFRPMKIRDVERKLKKLGFEKESATGGSHRKWRAMRKGKLYKVTVAPHKGEVRAMDIDSIIRQAGVTKRQWENA